MYSVTLYLCMFSHLHCGDFYFLDLSDSGFSQSDTCLHPRHDDCSQLIIRTAKWACRVGTAGGGSSERLEPRRWLVVDGGNNNKLGIMRVPETLIWAAFLVQKVSETCYNYQKTVGPCV